jgi:colanic acid biosynthesis glycosyl transferase WcaI
MRVLLINQCFFPDVAATAQHGWDLARRLAERGHSVTAIASRSVYGETGGTLPRVETVDGIQVVRVGTSFFGKSSTLGRAVDFLLFFPATLWAALRLPRQDVVVCFTTPPFINLVGLIVRALRRSSCITWLMDLYPDVPVALGMLKDKSILVRALDALSGWGLCRSDAVVVLGRCMQARVIGKRVPIDKLVRIPPWSSESPERVGSTDGSGNSYRSRWRSGARTLFMYSGNFGLGHDFDTIAEAFRSTCAEQGCQLALVGGGKRKAELVARLVSEQSAGAVVVEPYQPREQLPELLRAADVHLVSLGKGCEGTMVPSKFYGILAAGRPVIYVGEASGEVARVIEETGCGVVVAPGDVKSLSDAMRTLQGDSGLRLRMGELAVAASRGECSRDSALARWAALIESMPRTGL